MSPDDPRHGQWKGYVAGCREFCCREAARLYQKRRVHDRTPRRVSSVGLRRRVQALACLGWDMYAIGRVAGVGPECVRQWTINTTVLRSTHDRLATVYDELSMRLPPQDTKDQRANVLKTRNRAQKNGWMPPLAWDEGAIDDAAARPRRGSKRVRRTDIDEAVVLRLLAGERLSCTTAERNEAMRRWKASGRSERELCNTQGWHDGRYATESEVA